MAKVIKTVTILEALELKSSGVPFKVDSPDGFVPVLDVLEQGEKPCLILLFPIGRLECSTDQLVETVHGWKRADVLTLEDVVLTKLGPQEIKSITPSGIQPVYDLSVDHENHRYYGNDVHVHNCNTFGLFKFYLLNARSPIKNQPIPVQIDHKLEAVLRSMYRTGAPVNIDFFFYAGLDCLKYLRQIQAALNELAGYEVEIGSPKVLSRLLFDEFKLPPLDGEEKNKLGNYSTKEEVLDQLFEKHPDFTVLRYIVQYRKLANFVAKFTAKVLGNSYVDDFQMYARVQYAFSQTNVPTGRLSSSSGGSKERVTVKENKSSLSMTYKKDDWTAGYNSQGVSGASYRQAKCKKIKKLPERAGFNLKDLYGTEVREELIKAVATE